MKTIAMNDDLWKKLGRIKRKNNFKTFEDCIAYILEELKRLQEKSK